jgi:lysophospholipase L1-like esterase
MVTMKSTMDTGSGNAARSYADPAHIKLALLSIGVIAGLVLCEIALRVHNPFGFRMHGNTLVLPINQTYQIEDPNLAVFDKLDKHVTHTKNSLGFRGPEPPQSFEKYLTIVTIGGSTTECFYLSDDQTWPAVLDKLLHKNVSQLWVNNAGFDGHTTFGHLVLMQDYVSRLRPKVALFLVGINDLFADEPRSYDSIDRSNVAGAIANHSEVFALVLNLVRYMQTSRMKSLGAMPKPINLNVPEYRDLSADDETALVQAQQPLLRQYESRLTRLMTITRESGITPILITQPVLFGDAIDDVTKADLGRVAIEIYRPMNGRVAWKMLESYNDVTRKVGQDQGITVIDLAHQLPKSSRYFYDYLHYGREGAQAVGEIVERNLCPTLKAKWPQFVTEECDNTTNLAGTPGQS